MKHIKNFRYAQDYNKLHEEGGMIDVCPAVSYIDELQTVRIEPRGGAGTIVMANEEGNNKFLTIDEYRGSAIKDKLEEDGYTPIGVIVVPASHTKDGHARMMALDRLDLNVFANSNQDIPSLRNYEYFSAIATTDEIRDMDEWRKRNQVEIGPEYIGSYEYPIFASDMYFVENPNEYNLYMNPHDTQTCWIFSEGDAGDTPILPSPYLNDGSKNPIYHNEFFDFDGEKMYNALANLDGYGDTAKILEFFGEDSETAASTCYFYEASGYGQGEWYLPSVGELGYLFARSRRINAALEAVGGDTYDINMPNPLLSSTEYDDEYCFSAICDMGHFLTEIKPEQFYIHPFCVLH